MTKYTEGVVGQPESFFPGQAITDVDKTISSLIFRSLFKYDVYGEIKKDLVDKWEISEDGLVYTITIKDDQRWEDGSLITSDDLLYTAYNVPVLQGVGTDKVDDFTVRYILPNKFSPFPSLLTVGVMQKDALETQNKLKPITGGKFRVVDIKRAGPTVREILLYNTKDKDDIRKLSFRFYANEDELRAAAQLGEINGFTSTQDLKLEGFTRYRFPLQGVYYALLFNLRNDVYNDLVLRTKLRNSLPISDLVHKYGVLVQGPISKSQFTDESINFDHFDKDLIEETLYQKVTLTVPDIPKHIELAKSIKNTWHSKFNLDVTIKKVNPDKIIDEVIKDRDFEVLLYGQEVGRDPDRYVYWHSTQKEHPNLNLTGFEHVRADRALEEGRNESESTERRLHYSEFQKVVDEHIPTIFLYHPFVNYYISDYIDGVGEKYTFNMFDRFLDFSNWKRIRTN